MHYQLGSMDREGELPTLTGKLKVDWIDFSLDDILKQFTTLKEGILRGVFRQKTAAAWFGCRAEKAEITALLPGGSDVGSWLDQVDCMPHSWPKSCNIGKMQADKVHAKTFTSIASLPEPDTCGSNLDLTGTSCGTICTQSGRAFTPMTN